MNEKRFYIQDEKTIKDNKKYITENGYVLSYKNDAEKLCDLLNTLVKENEQLKKDLYTCHTLLSSKTMLENYNEELVKENEQLKQQIQDMQIRFKRKYDYEFDEIVDELE